MTIIYHISCNLQISKMFQTISCSIFLMNREMFLHIQPSIFSTCIDTCKFKGVNINTFGASCDLISRHENFVAFIVSGIADINHR